MLGWITKDRQPPAQLAGFPLIRQDTPKYTIYRLKGCTLPNPQEPKLIPIDANLSVFKVTEEANPLHYARPKQIGQEMELGAGKWRVPILRSFPDGTQLPRRLVLTEDGEAYQVKAEHLKAWSLGEKILFKWLSGEETATDAEIIDAVTKILAVNYYITEIDIKVFGLISTDTVMQFLEHAVDWDARIAFLNNLTDEDKKKLNETALNV